MSIGYRVIFVGNPPSGMLEFVSDACAALIDAAADDVIASPGMWMEAIHEDDKETFVQTTAQLIVHGEPVTRHYRVRGADGAYQMIEDRLAATVNGAGEVTGYESSITKAN